MDLDQEFLTRLIGSEFRKYSLQNAAIDLAAQHFDSGKNLSNEAQRLDILLRKKQLGIDMDDDEYQKLVNGGNTPMNKRNVALSSLMNSVPSHTILKAHFKTGFLPEPEDTLPNIMDAFKGGLGNVARSTEHNPNIVKQLTRFIGRRG
jgi:hypothetical protein